VRPPLRPSLLLFLLVTVLGVSAEVPITNPGFADRESLKYTETIGSVIRPFEVTLTLVSDALGQRYEFRSVGAELESLYRLDPTTLLSLSSESLTKSPDATVKRTAEYRNLAVHAGPDDLVLTDMGSLPVVLRGFPWTKTKTAKILYVGNTSYGGSTISFEVQVVGKDTVTAAGRTWDCWHATTGLGGALGLLLAKTDWWFAVEGTHPLVKTSGPVGGPGSPTRTLLLQNDTVGK